MCCIFGKKKKSSEPTDNHAEPLDSDYSRGTTPEQKNRDHYISKILNLYSESFGHKVHQSTAFRWTILIVSLVVIVSVTSAFLFYSWNIMHRENVSYSQFGAFATASVSMLGSIYGILTIITKFFFPEKDEEYITGIVREIQQSDLENRQLNVTIDENEKKNLALVSQKLFADKQDTKD